MSKLTNVIEKLPQGAMMSVMALGGEAMKHVANSEKGWVMIEKMQGGLGKTIAATAKAARVDEGRPAVEILKEIIEYFFAEVAEPVSDSADEYLVEFTRCPYGFVEGDSGLCHSAMAFEERSAESLGGRMIIEARLADGAPRCRFRIVNG